MNLPRHSHHVDTQAEASMRNDFFPDAQIFLDESTGTNPTFTECSVTYAGNLPAEKIVSFITLN